MSSPLAIFPQRHAFLIGAQAYTDSGIRALKTPIQDIRLMADALAAYGYQTHLCADPDRATFIAFLESIAALDPTGDAQVVIYYAGHGVALTQQQADGSATYGGYLMPVDARRGQLADTAISMQWLADQVLHLNGKQVLLILDCCYAGAVQQAVAGFRGGFDTEVEGAVFQEDFGHYTRYRANQILTSSAHNQQALDQYVSSDVIDEQVVNSPFAALLARALLNEEADTNHDGIVTVFELQAYVQQRLQATAASQDHDQTSCLFAFSSHEGGEFVFLSPSFDPASLANRQRVNPYKGLSAYKPEDSTFFFGRDGAIRDLNHRLATTRLVVVAGASGTGKSSLVMGGLLGPRQRDGATCAVMRPGKTPLAELARVMEKPPQLLLIDQLEELITQSENRADEALVQFFGELNVFLQSPAGQQTRVVATVRIEFVPQFNPQERFWKTATQQYAIPVLDVEALEEIIIRPALQTGMFYYPEKQTVARIIEDFRHYPNALPLLSLALNELYELAKDRPERTIYEKDYVGIGQILENKAAALMQPFSAHLDFFRNLLLRFVAFQGGEYVRRRVGNDELDFGPQQPLCTQMLTSLTDNRLVSGRDAQAGDGYYELTHEALIQSWSTFRQWIRAAGPAQLAQRESLTEASVRYSGQGQQRAYAWDSVPLQNLLRTSGLQPGRAWLLRSFAAQFGQLSWLSGLERAFLRSSVAIVRQNKLVQVGLGMLLLTGLGVVLFLQRQDGYGRLLSNARYAESRNEYKTAQQDYEAADTLVISDPFLRVGRRFLRFNPDSLPTLAQLAGQREKLFTKLSNQLEQADTLANNTVLLLAGRNGLTHTGTGVAEACRSFRQFIRTDAFYRVLDDSLRHPRTRQLLDEGTVARLRKRTQVGYQVTTVLRENLLATCREVQEGYSLNGQTDLARQYLGYISALEAYAQTIGHTGSVRQVASSGQ